MKSILHKANTRGHADFGWLNSYHTFSFGRYYNHERVHFGALRVLNDDTVKGGMGFGKHSHDNMEIVSIPLSGDLHHQDSTGRDKIIKTHDVQIMSAGSGIEHSEKNASLDKEVKFLQLWVLPKQMNIEPRYQQKSFNPENRINAILTVVAPDEANALSINQDAWFSLGNLTENFQTTYKMHKEENGVYVFVIAGNVDVNEIKLNERDGFEMYETDTLNIEASSNTEILLIEVPMHVNES